ncbi:hypothetical protein [Mycobacterium neumannii]|uniref:hypothetical protein n=1 Tax=Mycobacterium neumannii TaxID=2048551 RepID=UPI000F81AE0A|nr:hypothetical protein [Mycobacterium neumannii]
MRIKLVDEHVRRGKPTLHPRVCDFIKYSFGDEAGLWETEPWGVAFAPTSRKATEYSLRVVDSFESWEEIEAYTRSHPAPPGLDRAELSPLKRLPDGRTVLEVPPRKPKLRLRWEKVMPVLEKLALSKGYVAPDGAVLKDGDVATLTISQLRALYNAC